MARGLSPSLRRRLTPFGRPLVVAAALSAVVAVVPAAIVAQVPAAVSAMEAGDVPAAARAAVTLLAVATAGVGLRLARTAVSKRVAWRLAAGLRVELVATWLARADPLDVGDGLAAATDEVDQVQYAVSAVVTLLRDPLALLGLAVGGAWAAPGLVPLVLVLGPAWAVAGALTSRRVAGAARDQRAARASLASRVGELLIGRAVVRSFGASQRELHALETLAGQDAWARTRMDVERQLPSTTTELLAHAAVAVLLVRGAQLVAAGALEPGGLVAFVAALLLAQRPLARVSEAWSLLRRADAALARVEAVLAEAPERPPRRDVATMGPLPVTLRGAVVEVDGERLLGPVDLEVPAGAFVAIVGATGSGKSTLLSLVAGSRAPSAGEVLVGGEALAPWHEEDRARRVAAVPQDGFLFARGVQENLALGVPDLAPEAAVAALRAAHAGFVADARGLARRLGPGGAPLSGGERQRLALARALAPGTPLLVLDEPTNQVDAATELAVVASLQALAGRVTRVVACHDLAVAEASDLVVVLDRGRVVECGPPGVLRARAGAYARLAGGA